MRPTATVALRDGEASGYTNWLAPCVGRLGQQSDANGGHPGYWTYAACRKGTQLVGIEEGASTCTRTTLDTVGQFPLL